MHLSLFGRARKASSELTSGELKCAGGIVNLLRKLDRIFLQDENWRVFNNYLAFESYRRSEEESIDQFLSEFDQRCHKLKECGATLPDAVVACRLIKSCNLSEMHFQLALSTTSEMTFENMRTTLKRLFSEGRSGGVPFANVGSGSIQVDSIKSEPFVSDELYSNRFGKYSGYTGDTSRRNTRGQFRGSLRRGNNGENPIGRDGRVTTCNICSPTNH